MPTRRIKLTVAYEGTEFFGWQKQHPPDESPLRTAQGVLEQAVRQVVREEVSVHGASRTDSGVHALGQVAAFDTCSEIDVDRLPPAISSRLPDDIRVVAAEVVPSEFNVIGDVEKKAYRYRAAFGRREAHQRPLFDRRTLAWVPWDLDLVAMNEAAEMLVGKHDFASFTRLNHGRESTIRRVHACGVSLDGDQVASIEVVGEGFLWNMVRIIAGTLVEVGSGRRDLASVDAALQAGERSAAGVTMPPEGLSLVWIQYGTPGCGRQRQLQSKREREAVSEPSDAS
ncbi:MAG: tRNA pseudouridine(38-40) synthase TruA [Planctomycetes bacterium]|nr:tRNA pseudouridine(38-40) synthase TruA [Planctomycetota bacterium]MCP4838274.1 tRNA pseudouridine(38-40) synthase TruA [Planctomycetota bacterium]